jgi:hypothetical protein
MSRLILLSIPAICGIVSVAFTKQVLYPRLKKPPVLDDSIPVHVQHQSDMNDWGAMANCGAETDASRFSIATLIVESRAGDTAS